MKHSLSVIIPAYNEEENVESILLQATGFLEKHCRDYEILLIDDGSSDKTLQIATEVSKKHPKIKVFSNSENLGFGMTERRGLELARMELITLIPADNQFHVEDLQKYFELIDDCDIVVGWRIHRQDPLLRKIIAKTYTLVIAILFNTTWFGDIDWVKMYRRKILNNIKISSTTAFVDAEILIKAEKLGYKIKEVGVHHYKRNFGKQSGGNIMVLVRAIKNVFSFWLLYWKERHGRKAVKT